jgi:H+/gluconate symporter-like permease
VGRGVGGEGAKAGPSFALGILIVTLPLVLSCIGFGVELLRDLKRLPTWMSTRLPVGDPFVSLFPSLQGALWYSVADWFFFLGHPTMALLIPTGLAFWLLGARQGMDRHKLAKVAEKAIGDVGGMVFLFGAAGGFMQVIKESGAGDYIAQQAMQLPLSSVLIAYIVAVLCRIALGSATAAILTASAVLAGLAGSLPGRETLLVLAVANGVTFMTQPADSGFWLVKEYCNLSVRDVFLKFNACRCTMSISGVILLLIAEAIFF